MLFEKTLQSLCRRIALNWQKNIDKQALSEIHRYVSMQLQQSPQPAKLVIYVATYIFACWGYLFLFKPFYKLSATQQVKQIDAWQNSRNKTAKLLLRFYQSLILLKLYANQEGDKGQVNGLVEHLKSVEEVPELSEITVVGSGPGGAITATLLAEAGYQVVLIEEGVFEPAESYYPYSAAEFLSRFRHGGLGVMFGRTPISYLEGQCLGGGSEVNSGIYLPPLPETLLDWNKQYGVKQIMWEQVQSYFRQNETELGVSAFEGQHPQAGLKLKEGAAAMGWECIDTLKWRHYPDNNWQDNSRKAYSSMSKSFLPRFIRAGGRIVTGCRVEKITADNDHWQLHLTAKATGQRGALPQSKRLFICAGAVQTPALLLRSGITHNIGSNLHSSLIIKVIARFDGVVNSETMGMPLQQIREFAPKITFACAISNPSQLALGLQHYPKINFDFNATWRNLAAYSVIVTPTGRGRVGTLFKKPWVGYTIDNDDWSALGFGLKQLMRCLIKAGAVELYPQMDWNTAIKNETDINRMNDNPAVYNPPISSIHLSSSCCMGENKAECATDSYGKVYGQENLYINDASLLCSYPGANPQATIMAVSRRNIEHFINSK